MIGETQAANDLLPKSIRGQFWCAAASKSDAGAILWTTGRLIGDTHAAVRALRRRARGRSPPSAALFRSVREIGRCARACASCRPVTTGAMHLRWHTSS